MFVNFTGAGHFGAAVSAPGHIRRQDCSALTVSAPSSEGLMKGAEDYRVRVGHVIVGLGRVLGVIFFSLKL
jgi:hypothetical protein